MGLHAPSAPSWSIGFLRCISIVALTFCGASPWFLPPSARMNAAAVRRVVWRLLQWEHAALLSDGAIHGLSNCIIPILCREAAHLSPARLPLELRTPQTLSIPSGTSP